VNLPVPTPGLEGALRALLAQRAERDPGSGLSNPLYASQLSLDGIDRRGTTAVVRMSGYIQLGDSCENARIRAQFQETGRQFSDLTAVSFLIDGQPFDALVSESASIVPRPGVAGNGTPPGLPLTSGGPMSAAPAAPNRATPPTPAPASPDSAPPPLQF
jgi:hypothetical protein